MSQFEHKGTPIQLLSSGKFAAIIDGKEVRAASLDAIKKKIDGPAKPFEPFDALVRDRELPFRAIRIVGVKYVRPNASSFKRSTWLGAGGHEYYSVFRDTPENRERLTEVKRDINTQTEIIKRAKDLIAAIETRLEAETPQRK